MTDSPITLIPAEPADLPAFKRALQDAFALAVVDEFGPLPDGPIPSDHDLDASIAAPGAQILHIVEDGRNVGGAVVAIDPTTHCNRLDLFYVETGRHGRGLGRRAWSAIEARFPDTRTWETSTPYFEKRNIHFYVNVCGFRIVEFFNKRHPDPHPHSRPHGDGDPVGDEMFLFRKEMRNDR
ncbi:GNAT family N-acetyltransferase [Sphingomonas sp. Leaf10]|uniref:GNAT family N-acetyltransferase n=1 Tax=Sphingomonas sp. Leaf10 TaxID=1735676 RepID=UPI0006F497C0|nr:GNAT family N-acetyltransferase [Sphingomonas sp. Leaf10]KQM35883.1 hypothetical protein ASE59_17815 [Sphingomonas sp. Leaf10]